MIPSGEEGRRTRRWAGRGLLLAACALLLLAGAASGDVRFSGAAALAGLAWAGSEYAALRRRAAEE